MSESAPSSLLISQSIAQHFDMHHADKACYGSARTQGYVGLFVDLTWMYTSLSFVSLLAHDCEHGMSLALVLLDTGSNRPVTLHVPHLQSEISPPKA